MIEILSFAAILYFLFKVAYHWVIKPVLLRGIKTYIRYNTPKNTKQAYISIKKDIIQFCTTDYTKIKPSVLEDNFEFISRIEDAIIKSNSCKMAVGTKSLYSSPKFIADFLKFYKEFEEKNVINKNNSMGKEKRYDFSKANLVTEEKLNKKDNDLLGSQIITEESIKLYVEKDNKKITVRQINWEQINKKKNEVGYWGELKVYHNQIKELKTNQLNKLASKVEHVSVTKGDGLGYDILSYDKKGDEIFIEVKSTVTNSEFGFYMCEPELKTLKDNQGKYFIAWLYNINMQNNSYDIKYYSAAYIINECNIKANSFTIKK